MFKFQVFFVILPKNYDYEYSFRFDQNGFEG